jgi:hypothetical protein
VLFRSFIGISPVLGWNLEIIRRVVRGGEVELPEWTNLRIFWKEGGKSWLLNLAWLTPVILAILIIYFPLLFLRSIGTERLAVVELGVLGCMLTFITVYGMVVLFLLPAALGILAETGSLGKAINPMHAWRMARDHLGPHLLVFLIFGLGLTTMISLAAALTLFLALPPLLVYTSLVLAHYSGQLYRLHLESTPRSVANLKSSETT